MRHLPATCRMFCDDLVERALAAAQRPHPVVRVAVAVERDLDPVQAEGRSRSTTSGVSSRPLVMTLISIRTPRACEACQSRSAR